MHSQGRCKNHSARKRSARKGGTRSAALVATDPRSAQHKKKPAGRSKEARELAAQDAVLSAQACREKANATAAAAAAAFVTAASSAAPIVHFAVQLVRLRCRVWCSAVRSFAVYVVRTRRACRLLLSVHSKFKIGVRGAKQVRCCFRIITNRVAECRREYLRRGVVCLVLIDGVHFAAPNFECEERVGRAKRGTWLLLCIHSIIVCSSSQTEACIHRS